MIYDDMIEKAEYSNMSRDISEYNKGKFLLPVSKSFNYDPTYANTILRNNFNREVIKYNIYNTKQFISILHSPDYFCTEELCIWLQW